MINNREIYLIVGHRGTGKTTWVKEVKKYFLQKNQRVLVFDVDQEIKSFTRQTIDQMFKKDESYFREIENRIAKECIKKARSFNGKVFISLGAGYKGSIPSFCKVIHLKRVSDRKGRIFFDRPRILSRLNSFDEYQELYSKRKLVYEKQRDLVLTRLDYFKFFQQWDKVFLGDEKLPFKNGVLTLSEKQCPSSQEKLDFFLDQKLKWGIKYFELKDSAISNIFLEKILLKIPLQQIIFSFRNRNNPLFENFFGRLTKKNITIDRPLEWGIKYKIRNDKEMSWICSMHDRRPFESLHTVLDQFPKKQNMHLKLAVEIFSFEELWEGHLWQKEDPENRSFHPRSKDGRWKWYRLLFGPRQPLYFIREDDERGVLDQPVMAESVRCGQGHIEDKFACILGDPVEHSATPFEQQLFFKKYHLPVLSVLMREEEVTHKNMKILENFGMKFAAITSPLKKKFYQLCSVEKKSKKNLLIDKNSSPVSALNTLILTKKGWCGFNTDVDGAFALKSCISQMGVNKIAIWGGGGVRDVLDFIFTLGGRDNLSTLTNESFNKIINEFKLNADKNLKHRKNSKIDISFYSARTGKLLKGAEYEPDIVIWAVGRSQMLHCLYPPQHWKPIYVFDLNYTEDSPGREYAVSARSQYVSGWLWFKTQAQAQRILFEKL